MPNIHDTLNSNAHSEMNTNEHTKNTDTKPDDYIPANPLKVYLQPEEKLIEIPRRNARTVKRLLDFLNIKECTALVVRDNTLLTPDLALYAGDEILVRKVQSTG